MNRRHFRCTYLKLPIALVVCGEPSPCAMSSYAPGHPLPPYAGGELVPVCLATLAAMAVLYGMFFCLFCLSMYLLAQRQFLLHDGRGKVSSMWLKPPFLAGVSLWAVLTANEATYIWRAYQAFFGPETSWDFYGDVSQTSFYMQTVTSLLTLIISDLMMVYRLWIIWNYSWKATVLPVIVWLSGVGLCGAMMWQLFSFKVSAPGDFPDRTVFILATFADTAATNFYCSGMILYKLVMLARPAGSFSQRSVSWYLATLIEMAALYVGSTVLFIIVYATASETNSFFECAIPPVAGIAFMFINLRVALGYTPQSIYNQTSSLVVANPAFTFASEASTGIATGGEGIPLQSLSHGGGEARTSSMTYKRVASSSRAS